MEELINNQQVRPGDATQFMHVIFSSNEEMLAFYLTLSRITDPSSYLVERSDKRRLEDLAAILQGNILAFDAVRSFKNIKVKDVVRGLGLHMMRTSISNRNRLLSAESVGTLMDSVVNTTQNSWQFVRMNYVNNAHYTNVKYLLKLMETENDEAKQCETSVEDSMKD
ncbi:hypothetical protein [uncultured Bacteroides sp.]|uniref:hypothetical protein n=1 Tax=uncultured Bacteroides sp. TaxID=162156 RepID=UPI0025D76E68|nr:hypothetical protein [uncultured Bacteroides sp.]